jgi:hypothetical protein
MPINSLHHSGRARRLAILRYTHSEIGAKRACASMSPGSSNVRPASPAVEQPLRRSYEAPHCSVMLERDRLLAGLAKTMAITRSGVSTPIRAQAQSNPPRLLHSGAPRPAADPRREDRA